MHQLSRSGTVLGVKRLYKANDILSKVRRIVYKAPPPGGPPRPGLEWRERTHRWVRPKDESPQVDAMTQADAVVQLHPAVTNFTQLSMRLNNMVSHSDTNEELWSAFVDAHDTVRAAKISLQNYDISSFDDQKKALSEAMYNLDTVWENLKGVESKLKKSDDENAWIWYDETKKARLDIRKKFNYLKKAEANKRAYEYDTDLEFGFGGVVSDLREIVSDDYDDALLGVLQNQLSVARTSYVSNDHDAEIKHLENSRDTWASAVDRYGNTLAPNDWTQQGKAVRLVLQYNSIVSDRIKKSKLELVPRPKLAIGKAIGTGEKLQRADDLLKRVGNWNPDVSHVTKYPRGSAYHLGDDSTPEAVESSDNIVYGARAMLQNMQETHQSDFQDAVDNMPIMSYANENWQQAVLDVYDGKDMPSHVRPEHILGFCDKDGVNVPNDANLHTIIHEMSHYIDRWRPVASNATRRLHNVYEQRVNAAAATKSSMSSVAADMVTPYASTNKSEYTAECVSHYLTDPVKLYYKDREAYSILKDLMFQ